MMRAFRGIPVLNGPLVPALLPRNRGAAPVQRPAGQDWWDVRNSADGSTKTLYLYGQIGGGWWDEDPATADRVVKEIRDFAGSQLNVRVNSPGGMVFEGIAIANALRAHPAAVTVYVDGLAASIASVIAVSGDRTIMMPNSQMMVHEASGGCMGCAADMRKTAEMLDSVSSNIASAYADAAGGAAETWRETMRAETWYTASEAVLAGLANEVADASAPAPEVEPQAVSDELLRAAFRFAGRDRAPAPVIQPRNSSTPQNAQNPTPPAPVNTLSDPGVDYSSILSVFKEVFPQ